MKTIFIISKYMMFSRGLESLIDDESELKVVGQDENLKSALSNIRRLKPDVILILGDISQAAETAVLELLQLIPKTTVINLSIHDNTCYTFQASRWMVHGVSDFVETIKDPPVEVNSLPPVVPL